PYTGTPLLYARLDARTHAFTVAKNLMSHTTALDGDSSISADSDGHVYVAWHAQLPGGKGEEDRRVWLARSDDDGNTFAEETDSLPEPTGACACFGLTITAGMKGSVAILYRMADAKIHRGMRLL